MSSNILSNIITLGSSSYNAILSPLISPWSLTLSAPQSLDILPENGTLSYTISIQSQDAAKLRVPSTDYLYNVAREALFVEKSGTVSYTHFFVASGDVTVAQNIKVKTLLEAKSTKDILVIKLNVKDSFGDQVYWLPLKPVVELQQQRDEGRIEERQSNGSQHNVPSDNSTLLSPQELQKKIIDLEIEVQSLKSYIGSLRRADEEQTALIQQQNDEIEALRQEFRMVVAIVEDLREKKVQYLHKERLQAKVRNAAKVRGVGMVIASPSTPTSAGSKSRPESCSSPRAISARSFQSIDSISTASSVSHQSSTPTNSDPLQVDSSPSPIHPPLNIGTKKHSPSPNRPRVMRTSSKTALQMSVPGRLSSPSRRHASPRATQSPSTRSPRSSTFFRQSSSLSSPIGSPSQSARSPSDPAGPLFDDTVLLKSLQHQRTLSRFYGNKLQQWQLIYRASEDGFGSRDFHRCVDGKGPTLTVVQDASQGCLFGGYMSGSWHNKGRYIAANGCWLYSLRRPQGDEDPVKIPCTDNKVAAMGHKDKGATFGLGCDLYIADQCNLNNESYSHLGETYQNSYIHHDIDSKALVREFLCGAFKFRVAEVEVFVPVEGNTASETTAGDVSESGTEISQLEDNGSSFAE